MAQLSFEDEEKGANLGGLGGGLPARAVVGAAFSAGAHEVELNVAVFFLPADSYHAGRKFVIIGPNYKFENAMRGCWNGSYQEAAKAIDQLGPAASDISDMLDHCGKIDHHDYEQIQRMAEAFLHPKQLLMDVYEDTCEGIHDYLIASWIDSGEHFGQATAMILYGKT